MTKGPSLAVFASPLRMRNVSFSLVESQYHGVPWLVLATAFSSHPHGQSLRPLCRISSGGSRAGCAAYPFAVYLQVSWFRLLSAVSLGSPIAGFPFTSVASKAGACGHRFPFSRHAVYFADHHAAVEFMDIMFIEKYSFVLR